MEFIWNPILLTRMIPVRKFGDAGLEAGKSNQTRSRLASCRNSIGVYMSSIWNPVTKSSYNSTKTSSWVLAKKSNLNLARIQQSLIGSTSGLESSGQMSVSCRWIVDEFIYSKPFSSSGPPEICIPLYFNATLRFL